jgi:predicted glycogen debranching enzyme
MSNLIQHPAPGSHSLRFRGDTLTVVLENHTGRKGKAWLRANIGHARVRHREIIDHTERGLPPLSRDWHDFPMQPDGEHRFAIDLPLLEVGRFSAKAYFIEDGTDTILWPDGGNSAIKVEPAETCAGNTMYTAFVRQFGDAKYHGAIHPDDTQAISRLDHAGYTVIPGAGTFRDVIKELDFIVGTLRCKIVQLLPIHPVPTTYGRMGRFGSAFAPLDLFDVDPIHAEFDKLTTPLEQFQELVDEVHKRNARIYLDMPINHTGWGSHLQITHPEWFERNDDGKFKSPGAWGVEWADLVELNHSNLGLWQEMAEVFLFWCRRGVDGYRCDAGYMVPFEAWEYIIAKVRMEYPDTIFMLEGLGGYKHVTERLLADSGMNWAYSELFQNYDQAQVEGYLPESIRVSESKGNLIHFAETHDNLRLAATSHTFARLRTAFCALTSHNGAFGFANGVEWFASEQINVHNAHALNWGAEVNQVEFIRRLHAVMESHPSFHSGATVEMITTGHNNSSAILRTDATGRHRLLVLANLSHEQEGVVSWNGDFTAFTTDLISGRTVKHVNATGHLKAGEVLCLTDDRCWLEAATSLLNLPFHGAAVSEEQCLRAKAMDIFAHFDALDRFDLDCLMENPKKLCEQLAGDTPVVTTWQWPRDAHRTVLLPPGHFLLAQANDGFIAELKMETGETLAHEKSLIRKNGTFFALFRPLTAPDSHQALILSLTVFEPEGIMRVQAPIMQLCAAGQARVITTCRAGEMHDHNRYAVCTNRHGALAQVRIGWAELRSKYDGLLSANLHPDVPVDRHTMLTRCRAWVVRKGYSSELSLHCQKRFTVTDDGAVIWDFAVPVGEGMLIPLKAILQLHPDTNAVQLSFLRGPAGDDVEHLPDAEAVALILRPDIEDRCNHEVTKAFAGPQDHWPDAVKPAKNSFTFTPAGDRVLRLAADDGAFYPEPEWYYMIGHPVDSERGIDGSSDLFSPGYFSIELHGDTRTALTACINGTAEFTDPATEAEIHDLSIADAMRTAMEQFIVKRDAFQTVIAGYPWFLDWGRDTLICLRGIIAAGMLEEAQNILLQFALFEKGGTIPNMIRGNDDNNRETSDAPLWFFVACSELMQTQGSRNLLKAECGRRTLREVLISLAEGLINGTENGIRFDGKTGLIYSPSHFTWMDTNYPAGTPRQGYPIEIQALWHYALNLMDDIDEKAEWKKLADQVEQSISELFVIEADDFTYLADCLSAAPGIGARDAEIDDALRSNQLLAVTLGAVKDTALAGNILEACEQLLIPGAIRSLADRPVKRSAAVYRDGELLNDPNNPYWGHYSGDEDSRRKPAYHNGTAWTWPFPSYAEAMVMVYGAAARETALAILGSASDVINHGCLRQVPEVIDGNTPHTQRGCGAQAWGVTELYRVAHLLKS